jgi:hypothetical protein
MNKIYKISFIFILFLLFFSICSYEVDSQQELKITGPTEAFEGDLIEFTITLDENPVQAKVTFETINYSKASDRNTGKVNYTMPAVPLDGYIFVITATYFELSTDFEIFVKNKTSSLSINLISENIQETNNFDVTVTDYNGPVKDVQIRFNSELFTTDSLGNVTLFAPDVLVTTSYKIIANKTGYVSDSKTVSIVESNLGNKLMEIICPLIVEPGQQDIEVETLGIYGQIENVKIELYYQNELLGSYSTNNNGVAYIDAPIVEDDNYLSLVATKQGYKTYNYDEGIIISLIEKKFDKNLILTTIPSELQEGAQLTVQVKDDIGNGIEGASLIKGYINLDETTDSEGVLSFNSPYVFMDREYYIHSLKEGYNFATEKITVRNKDVSQENIILNVKNEINESEIFNIYVNDSSGYPLKEVTIKFNSYEQTTDENGIVSFLAPDVISNEFLLIEANKYGYQSASTSIEILDVDNATSESKKLKICVEPIVAENQEFTVTIRDENDNYISNARVLFRGTYLETDYKGQVSFISPDVSWDEKYQIVATKNGYESDSNKITIKNTEDFQYWLIVIAIVVVIIIGFIAYFRYGSLI